MAPGRTTELQMPGRLKGKERSPERTKVWTEPLNNIKSSDRRVPVIYYLSRNGQLEHPHFFEVPLSSPVGLHLRDVVNRLNFLRGNGMASVYSWSCKRSYKNRYVWHDLSDDDFIYPAHGQEYILKGSEIVEGPLMTKCDETVSSTSFTKPPAERRKTDDDHDFPTVAAPRPRRHQSWSSFDSRKYNVYTGETPLRASADASTQTDDKRHRRRRSIGEIEEIVEEERAVKSKEPTGTTDEISPPPSDSSTGTLENLMKSDGRMILRSETFHEDPTSNVCRISGRSTVSTVLMQLLSCGSIGFKDCGPSYRKGSGIPLGTHQKVPRGEKPSAGFRGTLKVEDREFFSGSLIETKKNEFPVLNRSSYNADR